MQEQPATIDGARALLMKMGHERCEGYITSARAILYLYQEDVEQQKESFDNLWHLIDLMAMEIDSLSDLTRIEAAG